jgi:hypothetical protein
MLYRSKQDLDPRALAIIEENAEMSERKPFMLRRSGDLELRDAVTKLKAIHDRRVAEQSAPETPNVDDSKCEAPTKPKDCSVNAILNAGRK